MLKGRGRASAGVASPTPGHLTMRTPLVMSPSPGQNMRPVVARTGQLGQAGLVQQRALPAKPEPDYEVVEFPSDQYVNAKLQPPPGTPPRPPTGHPLQAGASCGLCGGGGARVRCAECGRRALCASCDDMYHRHPKRRHHQRQALSLSQLGEDRPPLPPKGTPPVPPPRRHKMSSSPMPPMQIHDQHRATVGHSHAPMAGVRPTASPTMNQHQPVLVQTKMVANPSQLGSMPFLPTTMPHHHAVHLQQNANTLGSHARWSGPRGSLQGFTVPHVQEPWENPEAVPAGQWGRPMRRGASTLELGGGGATCSGCVQCAPPTWRYGSCATLDQPWNGVWPIPPQCCPPQQSPHGHFHMHQHQPMTPQPYRRADSRGMSRAASRAGSRAASPALSVRSRTSRRTKHRTPSPPLPSSDADSESESESETEPPPKHQSRVARSNSRSEHPSRPEHPSSTDQPNSRNGRPSSRNERPNSRSDVAEDGLGPVPPPPAAAWHCEHCTYVNEPGVRVCVICCRTPTAAPKVITEVASNFERLQIASRPPSPSPEKEPVKVEQVSERNTKLKKERTSTGCGPSPPREDKAHKKSTQRLVTPMQDQNGRSNERPHSRHEMAVGPSPPREIRTAQKTESPRRETTRVSPYNDTKYVETPQRHSISVGPSPPRDKMRQESNFTGQKKSAGTSPPRDVRPESRSSSITGKTNVSNTGTSPPPQSISTQTYEDPSTYERERAPSVARSRPRRRFRDDRRERSRSRHSLSSDTRESERSVRTTGAWEWRERDSSPIAAGEWGGKLARRASHLDLRRRDVRPRRPSLYGSEAPSPEPPSGRAISMEVLSGVGRGAERGLELARLLAEAERLGYTAAEVQVGLAQSPGAPLAWLRSRWAGLVGAVQGASARLAPGAPLSEPEARAALARHRGAVWPAVTECVDALRRQTLNSGVVGGVSAAGLVRGRVWGSPAGADDEAAPAREDSSDEYGALPSEPGRYDDWYPPIDDGYDLDPSTDLWSAPLVPPPRDDVALKLRSLLLQAGIPSVDENLLLKGLLADAQTKLAPEPIAPLGKTSLDLIQSENDFIDAYNALTRASPLPNIGKPAEIINTESVAKEQFIKNNDETQRSSVKETNKPNNQLLHHHHHHRHHNAQKQSTRENLVDREGRQEIPQLEIELVNAIKQSKRSSPKNDTNVPAQIALNINNAIPREIQNLQMEEKPINSSQITTLSRQAPIASVNLQNEIVTDSSEVQNVRQTDEKTSNLNQIVDNTQKLIQQMKEEINSDIHSLDDGHSQSSQSDPGTSSHDEQESTYSESEEETNHTTVTSDEKEITSSSSEEELNADNEALKSDSVFMNRTSSEDNEQFEEALDNLDIQIEDVKHANIEMLDSIARSLQEEHTISVELHEPKEYVDQNVSIVINRPKENNSKREDSNNNEFVAVNSFEEIYAELNTSKVNKIPVPSVNNTLKKSELMESIPVSNKKTFPKFSINESVFKAVSPTKIVILENTEPFYNAVIENIEVHVENSPVEIATVVIFDHTDESTNQTVNINTQEIFESEPVNDLNLESTSVRTEITETVTNSNSNVDETKSDGTSVPTDQNTNQQSNDPKTQITTVNISKDISQNASQKQTTPEKTTTNPTTDININKSSTATKSSIPKPVRQVPNNKSKNEKLTPKLLVSKVPVRRGSIKQNHAPAPPKAHFGNVQSGHVKQLQSKIFNSKQIKPQVTEIEIKPSTSTATLTKKGPAPQPPRKSDQKQPTPPKTSPTREKRDNYFRETCRTEDEWTESDSDESQVLKQTFNEEAQPPPPSPPPPITLRRVSGNIIDLARVRLPDGSPERQARMLLAEGATETWEQAHLAVELVSRGAELPAALLAALECADLPAALAYLHQDCELCASRLPEHEMVSMLRCTHRCCRECARLYFMVQITERSIADCVCPFCKMPELENLPEDAWLEYFSHLDIQLKTLLETDVHELFQRKLRDRTLAMDPNFRWCMECSSGFFVHPKHKKLRCPECRSVSCASCRKPWTLNHEGLSCEQYAAWLADNDPEISVAAVQQHLRENGLECPRCHFKYSLSRGGCMHFTCTQCKYEFCYGCGKPFTMGARCGLSEYCAKLGLHAHHPRNCLFYLRDKEPHELQTLLQMNNVAFEVEAAESTNGRCPIPLQRETPAGLVDGICGSEAPPKHAGLCKAHYVEYLAGLARALDPIPIMEVPELVAELRRRALPLPERGPWDTDPIYAGMCAEIVREKIPLD